MLQRELREIESEAERETKWAKIKLTVDFAAVDEPRVRTEGKAAL